MTGSVMVPIGPSSTGSFRFSLKGRMWKGLSSSSSSALLLDAGRGTGRVHAPAAPSSSSRIVRFPLYGYGKMWNGLASSSLALRSTTCAPRGAEMTGRVILLPTSSGSNTPLGRACASRARDNVRKDRMAMMMMRCDCLLAVISLNDTLLCNMCRCVSAYIRNK